MACIFHYYLNDKEVTFCIPKLTFLWRDVDGSLSSISKRINKKVDIELETRHRRDRLDNEGMTR